MSSVLPIPIYINKYLILDLYSILIDGYFDSKSIKSVKDKTDTLKIQEGNKEQRQKDYKKSKGDKEKNTIRDISQSNTFDYSGSLDDKNSNRNELTIKKIYTTFYSFYTLRNMMINKNMLKHITNKDIINKTIKWGEYIEFKGNICTTSILSEINNTIDIIEAYDPSVLNKLLKDKDNSITNYSVILKQLKNLSSYLTKNNTTNMIVELKNCKTILNVNLNYFLDKNSYIYDNAYSSCNILCKVIKVIDKTSYLNLLCKTGMSKYYSKFLKHIQPYLDLLIKNDIIAPKDFTTKINGPALQVIPIALYI